MTAVPTSVAAFVGFALQGPTDEPTRLTSWRDYNVVFGGFDGGEMGYSVKSFYDNGGTEAWFVRASGETAGDAHSLVGDAQALELADGSVDVVHAHQVLQHLPRPVAALAEFRRVARPGGIVAVRDSDYEGFRWFPEVSGIDRWLELYLRAARANGGTPDAGRRLLGHHEADQPGEVGRRQARLGRVAVVQRGYEVVDRPVGQLARVGRVNGQRGLVEVA